MESYKVIMGIDPGIHGGIAIGYNDKVCEVLNMPETLYDLAQLITSTKNYYPRLVCYLEKVGQGIPGQSSSATARFARHCGHLEGVLAAVGVPVIEVTPQKWQHYYSNQLGSSRGVPKIQWKNRLKGEAQRRFPQLGKQVTLKTADALLIMNYGINQEKN